MEQTQARMMTALAAVLLIATAALYLWESPAEAPDPEATAEVWQVETDEVVRVRVERPDDTLELVREGDRWELVEPFEAETDPDQVRDLLDALGEIRRGIPVDAEPSTYGDFGLGDPPVARVVVTLEDGTTRETTIGSEAPVGFRTYVLGAEGGVVAVNGRPGDVLTDPASRFRDHRIFDFDASEVRRVTIEGPQGTLSVHGRGTSWWLDGWTRADPDAVDDLVVGLLDLRFDLFQDHPGELGAPVFTVTVETEGGGTQQLFVGEQTPMGTVVWTSGEHEGLAFPESLTLLVQGPTDVGDPRAFPLDPEVADAVAVTRGDRRWEAARNGNAWEIAGEASIDAQMMVDALAAARIHYRREPGPPLSQTWATVEITDPSGIRVVDVGQEVEGSWRVARDRAGGEPYLVPLHDLEAIAELPAG